ncbi:MAG TPA: hypothetical protein VHJ57_01935 [Nitrososphaeraceae archaeon]|nr:hypothetical protein [Nitrososphaeraceae archaeon]
MQSNQEYLSLFTNTRAHNLIIHYIIIVFLADRELSLVISYIGVGFIADLSSSSITIQLVARITMASGVLVYLMMKKTRKMTFN